MQTDNSERSCQILVWGGGAIGATIAGFMARAGESVLLVDVAREHVDAIKHAGLTITGRGAEFNVVLDATMPSQISGAYDLVFLCVKAHQTENAMARIAEILTVDGAVVSMQNGLCEHAIMRAVGAERTIGATINFGAYQTEPGKVLVGNPGTIVIGELDGRETLRCAAIADLLRHFEPNTRVTANIWGYIWAKLAYSTLIKASALDNEPMVTFFTNSRRRSLHLGLIREVLRVARAEKVEVEALDGFTPRAFETGDADAFGSLDRMAEFFGASVKPQSTVWQDLAVLKRKTDAPAQLAPLFAIAEQHGLPVPLCRKLAELILAVENGTAVQGERLLDDLETALAQER